MKTFLLICTLLAALQTHGQTIVTLVSTNETEFYPVQSSDIVTVLFQTASAHPTAYSSHGPFGIPFSSTPQVFTDVTNLSVLGNGAGQATTFQIVSQNTACVSNYVPADAIVIPASATGSVNIILETSPDLVNWTAASPGTYSAANGTNRFFRVRAQTQ